MNQFFLLQGLSKELHPFAHIIEFAIKRNSTIQLNSFTETVILSQQRGEITRWPAQLGKRQIL